MAPERPLVETAVKASVDVLAERVVGLHADVKRLRKLLKVAAVVVVLLLVCLSTQIGFDTYQQVQRNRQAKINARILRTIEDATTPGHPIYQRGQQDTANAVRSLLVCGRAYADNATHGTPIPPECP